MTQEWRVSGRVLHLRWLAWLVPALVVLAACSSEDSGPTTEAVPTPAAATTETTEAQTTPTATTSAPGTTSSPATTASVVDDALELPDVITIPTPDGGRVTMAGGGNGSTAFAAVQYPSDRFDEIVTFYKEWTAADARDWSETESTADESDPTSRSAFWLSESSAIAVAYCGSSPDAFDSVCVTIEEGP